MLSSAGMTVLVFLPWRVRTAAAVLWQYYRHPKVGRKRKRALLLRREVRARLAPTLWQEARVTPSDDSKISEDRREALRYALAIGSGAALASALASPAAAQSSADNTLDAIRANKALRIAVLPGELPYFSKDLATGTWSGFSN